MAIVLRLLHAGAVLSSAWLLMHTMSYMIEISQKKRCRFLLFLGCSLLCSMIIFIGDPFNILGTAPIFLIIVLLTCKGSFWKKVTIGLMFASTIFSFNALRDNYIHDFLLETFETFAQVQHGYLISCLFSLPFALVLYFCTRKFAPDKEYTLSGSMWRLLLLLTITPLGIVLDVVTLFQLSDHYVNTQSHQEYAILLLISLFAFISLLWCVTVLARQQKLEQQSMFTEINRKYYEAMEQQHFEVRRLKHDLANHMQVLSALPEEQRESYVRELAGNAAFSQSFACCGDPTVNAVLTVKRSVMERCRIRMKMDLQIPAQLPYDKTDICALYANALDNAMEACMKLDETQREICLKCRAGKGLFCLEVSNPDPSSSRKQNPFHTEGQAASGSDKTPEHSLLFLTSKPDKTNHGYGLKSIQDIITRYQGHMEIKAENGIFDLFLYLPLLK